MANGTGKESCLGDLSCLLPALTLVVAYFLYDHFKDTLAIEGRTPMAGIVVPSTLPNTAQGEAFVVVLSWGVSALVYIIASLGATIIILVQIGYSVWRETGKTAKTIVAVVSFAALGVSVAWGHGDPMTVEGMKESLTRAFDALAIPIGDWALEAFNGLGIAIACLLVVTGGAALWATNKNASRQPNLLPEIEELRKQVDAVHRALYAGAVALVAAVMQAQTMHLLPTALVSGDAEATMKSVAQAYSAAQGTVWTIALLAFYLPTMSILSIRVFAVARKSIENTKGPDPPLTVNKWLENHGLAPSLGKRIVALGAALAPFLTGGTIIDLLKMVG